MDRSLETGSDGLRARIDRACDQFEGEWKRGHPPSICVFLAAFAEVERSDALRALLPLDVSWRQRRGERPTADDYADHFSQEIIAEVFADSESERFRCRSPADDVIYGASEVGDLSPPKFIGRYQVLDVVARGGFGQIYKGLHPSLNREVAIKVLHQDARRDVETDSLLKEARRLAPLEHPAIARVFDADFDPVMGCFVVMELVNGEGLHRSIRKQRGPFDWRTVMQLATVIADALEYLHEQDVVHRDIKPANIIIPWQSPFCPSITARIVDFGLSTQFTNVPPRVSGLAGTPAYMAPELWEGYRQPVGPAVDVWSLGVLMYELLTGRQPFRGRNITQLKDAILRASLVPIMQVNPHVPHALAKLCLQCLAKRAAKRPTARQLTTHLRMFARKAPKIAERGLNLLLKSGEKSADAGHRFDALERLATVLVAAIPDGPQADLADWARWKRILPHVTDVLSEAEEHGVITANLAQLAFEAGRFLCRDEQHEQATPLYHQSLRIAEAVHGSTSWEVSAILNDLALIASKYRAVEAVRLARRSLKIVERLAGRRDHAFADAILTLAIAYEAAGRADRARRLYERAVARIRRQPTPEMEVFFRKLASFHSHNGEITSAINVLSDGINTIEQSYGSTNHGLALLLNNLGALHVDRNSVVDAEPCFRRALEVIERSRGLVHPDRAKILQNLAAIATWRGDHQDARRLQRAAHDVLQSALGKDHVKVADFFLWMGDHMADREDERAAAIKYVRRARRILELNYGPHHLKVAHAHDRLASAFVRAGDPKRALALIRSSLRIRERLQDFGGGTAGAQAVCTIRNYFELTGNARLASQLLSGSLRIIASGSDRDARVEAWCRYCLGVIETHTGERASAASHFREALEKWRLSSPVDIDVICDCHLCLARAELEGGNHEKALLVIGAALSSVADLVPPDHHALAELRAVQQTAQKLLPLIGTSLTAVPYDRQNASNDILRPNMPAPSERRADLLRQGFRFIERTTLTAKRGVAVIVEADSFLSLTDPDHLEPRTDRQRRIYRVSAPLGMVDKIPAGFGLLSEDELIAIVGEHCFRT